MRKKVVLIYPCVSPTMDYHWFPWSILGVAQAAQDAGYDAIVWDQRTQDEPALLASLDGAVAVGISVMVGYQIRMAIAIAQSIRTRHPNLPLIWGGPFVHAAATEIVSHPLIDILAVGPGEATLPEILGQIASGAYHVGSHTIHSSAIRKPAALPRWQFGFVDIAKYINPETYAMAYVSSYGCTNHCSFCHIATALWQPLPEEMVLGELEHLTKTWRFRNVTFHDANFFPSERRIRTLARGILDRSLGIKTWHANARADQLLKYADATLETMVESGCNLLFVGVETGSPRLLPMMNKDETLDEIAAFVERMAAYPIHLHLHFMFGIPGETPDDVRETIAFYDRLERSNPRLRPACHFYSPYPGTELFRRTVQAGYSPPNTLDGWAEHDSLRMSSSWMDTATRTEIEDLVNRHLGMHRGDRRSLLC